MARTGIRFRPPPLQGSLEIDWVLRRAFAVSDGAVLADLDRQAASDLAQSLGLRARIRSRTPRERLEAEIGSQAVAAFDRESVLNTGMLLQHERVCRDLATLARRMTVPLILLKGMALHFLGVISPGGRRIADIDVLVPRQSSEEFHQALTEAGCEPSGIRAPEHHLSVLEHPLGSAIEVHHEIDGVRFERAGYASGDQCLERDFVARADEIGAGVFLPTEPLLAAHVLAHGLSHHGQAPDSYPAFQMLADLQDLGWGSPGATAVPKRVLSWIAAEVSREEAEATLTLVRDLSEGARASDLLRGQGAKTVLLRHLLAGALSAEYLQALKLSRRLAATGNRGRLVGILATAWQSVWLSRLQVEMLYGQPRTALGYLGWRLWRPFDLAGRTVRSMLAWLGVRLRR